MPRYSRLSPLGVSGRFIGVIVAATGTMACGGTLTGVSSDSGGTGSIAATSTFTGVGRSIAESTGSILARWLDTGGVGASIVSSTGSISSLAQAIGSSGGAVGRLTALGVTGRFFSPTPKGASVPRLWNVAETFGLNAAISDFTERRFFLVDTFGLNLSPVAAFTGAVGLLPATSTWSGASLATAASAGSLPVTTTWSGAGQNVIIHAADGALSVAVAFNGQGSTAGTVFGVGVGSLSVAVSLDGVGRSNAAADGAWGSVSAHVGVGAPLFTAIGSVSAASSWSGDSTVNVPGAGDISAVSTWTGATLSIAAPAASFSVTSTWVGVAVPPEVAPARRNRHTLIPRVDRSTKVIRKIRRTVQ